MAFDRISFMDRQSPLYPLALIMLLPITALTSCSVAVDKLSFKELQGKIAIGGLDHLTLIEPAEHMPCTGEGLVLARWLASFPSWSPDGKRLVFSRWEFPSQPSRFLVIVEGDTTLFGARYLTIFEGDTASSQELIRIDTLLCDFPSWSPDGSKIAFLGMERGSFRREELPISFRLIDRIRALFGKKVVYHGDVVPTWGRLYVADVTDRALMQVTHIRSLLGRPSWSPDSREIMFAAVDSQIVTVRLCGGITRRLGHGVQPAWSPDGGSVAFYRRGGIYAKNLDGTACRIVVRPERLWRRFSYCGPSWPEAGGGISWSPDSRYIVYVGANRFQRLYGAGNVYVVVRLRDHAMARLYWESSIPRGCSWTR